MQDELFEYTRMLKGKVLITGNGSRKGGKKQSYDYEHIEARWLCTMTRQTCIRQEVRLRCGILEGLEEERDFVFQEGTFLRVAGSGCGEGMRQSRVVPGTSR